MLKVSSVLSDTPTQPLVDSSVNDVLVKSAPFCNQSFFQMVDVTDPATVDSLLQNAPDCRPHSQLDWGLRCSVASTVDRWSQKSGVSAESSATVSFVPQRAVRRRPLPDLRSADAVVSLWCNRRFTEESDKFLPGNLVFILLAPYPFSTLRTLIKTLSSFHNILFINKMTSYVT